MLQFVDQILNPQIPRAHAMATPPVTSHPLPQTIHPSPSQDSLPVQSRDPGSLGMHTSGSNGSPIAGLIESGRSGAGPERIRSDTLRRRGYPAPRTVTSRPGTMSPVPDRDYGLVRRDAVRSKLRIFRCGSCGLYSAIRRIMSRDYM